MFSQPDLCVAAIFAHPDDEVLGAGASLARHAAAGQRVETLIVSAGLDSRGDADAEAHAALKAEAHAAAACLGISPQHFADLPDNQLDSVPFLRVVQTVERFVSAVRPAIIYTHHTGDLNIDHRLVHQAVVTACRPLAGSSVRRILAGEVLSSTEWQSADMVPFQPTVWHDVRETLACKVAAMAAYANEARPFPHPRSAEAIEALARFRGVQGGFPAAEAFVLVKEFA
ncbi:PIG-L deacetylase family protein [Insolitispirillum peregrinum]|uniref:PIG-L deacetylase family protein n=1 Tax=Insolitispirillum peregrinum TaxID=80876 RepID=UPI00360DC49D